MAERRSEVLGCPGADAQRVRSIRGVGGIDNEPIDTSNGFMPGFRHDQRIGEAKHMLPLGLVQTELQTTQKGQEVGRMLYNELEQGDILSGGRCGLALLAYTDILLCSIWAIYKIRQTPEPYYTNGAVHVEVRLELGARSYAYDWRLYLREKTVRRLNRQRTPEQRLRFRKKTTLAQEMLAELQQLLPAGFQVYVLFDSWYAANRLLKFCRRQDWHVVCAIKSNRKLDDQKLSQWPQALRHQRYQRVQLTATDGRQRSYLVRPLQGRLNHLPFDVCVLISKRHHRDNHPKYFLCTDPALSAQQILSIYQKRWPIEVDNFYIKQHLGLADFRVQSYEATEKWFAVVFLALVFLQWRLNHAHTKEPWHSLADMVRQHRYEHARTLLETACQEAAKLGDYLPILKRFVCEPT